MNQPASFAVQLNGARGVIDARVHTPSGAVEECYVSELDSGELAPPLPCPAKLGEGGLWQRSEETRRLTHQPSASQISTPSASSPTRTASTQLMSSSTAPTSLAAPSRSVLGSRAKLGTQAWCQLTGLGLKEGLRVGV